MKKAERKPKWEKVNFDALRLLFAPKETYADVCRAIRFERDLQVAEEKKAKN